MFDRRQLTKALDGLGFRAAGPLQYELRSSEPVVHKYLCFRLLGIYRWELEGTVGFMHPEAEAFAVHCLKAFGGSWWQWALTKKSDLPFTAQCRIGKLAGWKPPSDVLNIQKLTAAESAARVRSDVEKFVLPFLARIQSARDFLELLIRNEEPMPWHQWGPVHRLCQIVFLANREGVSNSTYAPVFEVERRFLTNQLNGPDLNWFLGKVQEAAAMASNSTVETDARNSGARGSL